MAYTPLITADFFTGPKADVLLASGGILSVAIIIIAVGLLVRVLSR